MIKRLDLDFNNLPTNADWHGNNAAFSCPNCNKIFIVSGFMKEDKEGRVCRCKKSKAFCSGPPKDGQAYLEYEERRGFWKTKIDMPYWQLMVAVFGLALIIRSFYRGYLGQSIEVILDAMVVVILSIGLWKVIKFLYLKCRKTKI